MNISKFKAVLAYLTGGVAGVVEYILEVFNALIQKLPKEEVAKYAQVAKDIALFIANIANTLIKDAAKKEAAIATAKAFENLAIALLDCEISKEELENVIETVKVAIEAWKKVS